MEWNKHGIEPQKMPANQWLKKLLTMIELYVGRLHGVR